MYRVITTISIIIIILALLFIVFAPKDVFNQVLYGITSAITHMFERKIDVKQGEVKQKEGSVKALEEQSKQSSKKAGTIKKRISEVKPPDSVQELKKESADLGYPTK